MVALRFLVLASSATIVAGHMGISNPVPVDQAAGDAYRYPVSSDNQPTNGGACHGKTDGAKYAWVWTPRDSGTCEIYQNCFTSNPGTLTMSGGAPHSGGKCKLYKCEGTIGIPRCTRMSLVTEFTGPGGKCTEIQTSDDCTTKGTFPAASGETNPQQPVTPVNPPTMVPPPASADPAKIRCGTSWQDANAKCGLQCKDDKPCADAVAGERCYADLTACSGSNPPSSVTTAAPPVVTGCVSKVAHISDQWCKAVNCHHVYQAFCGTGTTSKTVAKLNTAEPPVYCQLDSARDGQTLGDLALRWDVSIEEMEKQNPTVAKSGALPLGTIIEVPGDCEKAKQIAAAELSTGVTATPMIGLVALMAVIAVAY